MTANLTLKGIQEELSKPLDIALTVHSGYFQDWWAIEREEHAHKDAYEPLESGGFAYRYTGRISDADVEGSSWAMLEIASAVETGQEFSDTRCQVRPVEIDGGRYWEVSSPRNSRYPAVIPHYRMLSLAAEIRQKVKL